MARLDKVRPIVVLSRDPIGRVLDRVVAAPITSRVRGLATEVLLGPADGVEVESVANLDNLQLVERARLVRRVGRARPATLEAICGAASIAIGCETD